MLAKKSSSEKARGSVRRAIVVEVVMATAAKRTPMKSVRTTRVMLTRQIYIHSLEIFSKGTFTLIHKIIRTIFPASMRRSSSTRNWRLSCPTPGRS